MTWHEEARALRDVGYSWEAIAYLLKKSTSTVRVVCVPDAREKLNARMRKYDKKRRLTGAKHLGKKEAS